MNLNYPYLKYARTTTSYAIHVERDGDTFIALLGSNLHDGIIGVGSTLGLALHDLSQKITQSEFAGYNK